MYNTPIKTIGKAKDEPNADEEFIIGEKIIINIPASTIKAIPTKPKIARNFAHLAVVFKYSRLCDEM